MNASSEPASTGEGPPDLTGWIEIGRILKPRGRFGELLAIFDSPKPDRADSLSLVAVSTPQGSRKLEIENVWYHDGRPVLKFQGVDSISDAEPLAGATLLVPASERIQLDEGEYFDEDLVGCVVELAAPEAGKTEIGNDEPGKPVGIVEAVEEHGGPSLLRVKLTCDIEGPSGEVNKAGKQVLIPFVRAICHDIDVAAKRIRADIPDGLFDL